MNIEKNSDLCPVLDHTKKKLYNTASFLYDLIGSVVLLLQNLNFTLVLFSRPVIADAHRQDPSCIFGLSGHIAFEFQGIFFIPDLLDCRIRCGVNF